MLLEDMTVRSYADGKEKITSIDAAQFSVSEKGSPAFEGMAETMRFEGMSQSGANSILQMAESTNEPTEIEYIEQPYHGDTLPVDTARNMSQEQVTVDSVDPSPVKIEVEEATINV